MQPVFRFAPSPNGFLHLGHALSALLNADAARRMAGRLLLRIEDIDPERSRETYVAALLEDLDWLGFAAEEPVLRQSSRMEVYSGRLGQLRQRGLVYRCFCSRGFTARAVAEHEASGTAWPRDPDGAPFHAGPCALLDETAAETRAAAGEPHTWRLRMDAAMAAVPGPLPWIALAEDTFAPTPRRADPARWGDAVLARRDVPTSYHLAVVTDDAAQGVTHVVRGRDLEPATDLHRLLQALLGLPTPLYCHHRLLLGPDGQKLAKSAGSTALRDLRAAGWTPVDVRRAVGLPAPDP
ncbi:tRNA glutamyl-Q(34) synthetase GluQRS [Alsobacter sp. R-9]